MIRSTTTEVLGEVALRMAINKLERHTATYSPNQHMFELRKASVSTDLAGSSSDPTQMASTVLC